MKKILFYILFFTLPFFAFAGTIHNVAKQGYYGRVKSLIEGNQALVNAEDEYGYTPLIWSLWRNDKETAMLLIKNGADVNVKPKSGITPLYWAIEANWPEVVLYLIQHEADVNAKTTIDGYTPLMAVAQHGNLEATKALLENKADVHAKNNYRRASLYYAEYYKYPEIASAIKNSEQYKYETYDAYLKSLPQ